MSSPGRAGRSLGETRPHVVAVCGSRRDGSYTRRALQEALAGVEAAGGTTELLDLAELHLPPLDPDVEGAGDGDVVRQTIREADAVLLGTPMTWEPTKRFSSTRARQPRDFFTKDERNRLREAALELGSVPNYYDVPASDRSKWRAYLAQRFGKPKSEVTLDDWQRANSWKIPSLLWVTLDAGLRPVEVERARVSWVDTENAVLRIPKEESTKNHENWQTSLQQRTVLAVEKWLHERTLRPEYEETDALWVTKHGNPYGSQALNPLLRRVCDVAGIDLTDRDLTWYSIRHSVGTYMTEERGLKAAATQLRHKTIRSTIKYDQAPLEARREALERMGSPCPPFRAGLVGGLPF